MVRVFVARSRVFPTWGGPHCTPTSTPLEVRLRDLEGRMEGTRVLQNLRRKLRAYHDGNGQFGYEMFVLARR